MKLETFFTVTEQAEIFLLAVVLGAALGVVFDAFRMFRAVFVTARKKIAVGVADFLFVLFYAFCIFIYSVMLGRGEVRFFIIIGSLCGFVLEVITIGDTVTSATRFVSDKIHGYFKKLWDFSLNFRSKFRHNDSFSAQDEKTLDFYPGDDV
jgi:hypothetical protein